MNLSELITSIQDLALTHNEILAAQTGNVFDVATSKSSEVYPAMWIELPVLIDYNDNRKKNYTFALNFLTLCKYDDLLDAIQKTSDMEAIADEMLQAIQNKFQNIGISDIQAITLRNFSTDDLVGVRVDVTFYVGRECNYMENFNTKF
jgi:hypothetical protein